MSKKIHGTEGRTVQKPGADAGGAATDGQGVTLLVVDDEPGILCALRWILKTAGIKMMEASNGEEAVRVAAAHDGPIDLMLTDVDMPGMGGIEAARAIRGARPGLPVLFMSGVRTIVRGSRIPEMDEAHFIEKPFTSAELLAKIRALLAT